MSETQTQFVLIGQAWAMPNITEQFPADSLDDALSQATWLDAGHMSPHQLLDAEGNVVLEGDALLDRVWEYECQKHSAA